MVEFICAVLVELQRTRSKRENYKMKQEQRKRCKIRPTEEFKRQITL